MNKRNRNKLIVGLSALGVVLFASPISGAFALFVRSANPISFGITGATTYSVTYHYPSSSDDGTFTEQTVNNLAQNSIIINQAPNTNNIVISNAGPSNKNNGTYTFEGWYTASGGNKYATKLTSGDLLTANTDVYAKYVCANTLHYYDGSNQVFTTSDATDLTIPVNKVEYGTRILGYCVESNADVDNYAWTSGHTDINLTSASGIYKLTRNGTTDWTVERKIGIKPKMSWWWDSGDKTYVYCSDGTGSLANNYDDDYFSAWGDTIYVDARYTSFLLQRFNPSITPSGSSQWNNADNNAGMTITLVGYNDYSSSKIYAMINDGNTNMAWVDSATNDMPY